MRELVLDSFAVLEFLFNGQAAEEVDRLLSHAATQNQNLVISAVNWTEVLYRCEQEEGQKGTIAASDFAQRIQLEIVEVTLAQAERAAYFKARHKISLADAFAAALTKERNADIVTGDPEFKSLAHEIKIHWLRNNLNM